MICDAVTTADSALLRKMRGKRNVFFFFQAEDGIRVADVTGVQTCALPISGVLGVHESVRLSRVALGTAHVWRLCTGWCQRIDRAAGVYWRGGDAGAREPAGALSLGRSAGGADPGEHARLDGDDVADVRAAAA